MSNMTIVNIKFLITGINISLKETLLPVNNADSKYMYDI